jgi:hypothetical protein
MEDQELLLLVKDVHHQLTTLLPGIWSINDAYNYKKAGQWTNLPPVSVDYLVVAGGGGGGANCGGGGGAGGYRTSFPGGTKLSIAGGTSYPITVGAGGTGANPAATPTSAGSPSIFSSITSIGGGNSIDTTTTNSGGSGSGMGEWCCI